MPDGTFRPDAPVTVPETVAFLMKYVNVAPAPDLAWPENYLKGAQDAGLIWAEDMAVIKTMGPQLAIRGMAFHLADWVFYHYKLPEGGTVYTTFVDVEALPNQGRYTVTLPWDPEKAESIIVSTSDLAGNVAEQSIKHVRY